MRIWLRHLRLPRRHVVAASLLLRLKQLQRQQQLRHLQLKLQQQRKHLRLNKEIDRLQVLISQPDCILCGPVFFIVCLYEICNLLLSVTVSDKHFVNAFMYLFLTLSE